jgi:small basic protein (TIGR04137 family)
MSLDRSLKSANSLIRHRNVLTRAERLDQLTEEEKWTDAKSVFGLPKVGHRKQAVAKAVKENAAAVPGAPGAAPAAGAPAAKGATPAAKASAPAAGAKGAAPAAKKK